jgi:adenylosuccinate lyase
MSYFTQIPVAGATGSSTMPHKVNPIRFENAEANLELSSALLDSLSATLVTSRLQRDLTDSTTQRNIGVALGHSLLALDNIRGGLGSIALNRTVLARDLPLMALLSFSITLFGINFRRPSADGAIGRSKGLLWLAVYVAYTVVMYFQEVA